MNEFYSYTVSDVIEAHRASLISVTEARACLSDLMPALALGQSTPEPVPAEENADT